MRLRRLLLALWATLAVSSAGAATLGTAFTYQGRLTDAGAAATGAFDFQFILYDAAAGGSQVGPIVLKGDVAVAGSLFEVSLDFGAVFSGSARWLEIGVRPGASTGGYSILSPRQELTPAPNALHAASATTVAGLTCINNQVAKWNAS